MSTFQDCATDALQSIGQVGIGQNGNASMYQQALRVANRMVQKWSLQKLMLYVIGTSPYALSATVQDYTIGPTGATFTGARPIFVEAAQAVMPGTTTELPMNLLDKTNWGAIRDKGAQTSASGVPSDIWVEYTYPNLAFHVWPIPASILTVKLATWALMQQFVTIFDTFAFPPGYEEPFVNNLAFELSQYYDLVPSPGLQQLAAEGLLRIQTINTQTLGQAFGESLKLEAPNLATPPPTGQAA